MIELRAISLCAVPCDDLGDLGLSRALVAAPDGLTLDELAEAVAITRSGGTFGTYLSRLRSNGLIEKDGDRVRVAGVLVG